MLFLRDFIGQELQWKRPRFFSSSYELHVGDQILATVNSSGILKQSTVAEAEGQLWTFKRTGFTGKKFLIYPGGPQTSDESVQPLAWIQPDRRKNSELKISTGDTYTWTHTGTWRPTWAWIDSNGAILLTLKKNRVLEITTAASGTQNLALLTVFGFYLITAMEGDEATAISATAAVQ